MAAGLSHGVEEGPSRVASGATDEALFPLSEASRRSQPPRKGSEAITSSGDRALLRPLLPMMLQPLPLRVCCREAAPPLSTARQGKKKKKKNPGKTPREKARCRKKSPAVVSARCRELALALSLPPALWELLPPRLLGDSGIWGLGGFKSQAGDDLPSLPWSLPLQEPQALL